MAGAILQTCSSLGQAGKKCNVNLRDPRRRLIGTPLADERTAHLYLRQPHVPRPDAALFFAKRRFNIDKQSTDRAATPNRFGLLGYSVTVAQLTLDQFV